MACGRNDWAEAEARPHANAIETCYALMWSRRRQTMACKLWLANKPEEPSGEQMTGSSAHPKGARTENGHLDVEGWDSLPKYSPPKRPRVPRTGTLALRDYLTTFIRTEDFLHFVLHMALHLDRTAEVATKALADVARSPEEAEGLLAEWRSRAKALDMIRRHRQFLVEVLLTRHVDNYLSFLGALLAEIFVARPETLRSNEKVEVEWVLGHGSIPSLIQGLAERKVDALAYASFSTLREHMKDRYGLTVCEDSELPAYVRAIELRNLAVHNRCIVNRRFLERTAGREQLGAHLVLGVKSLDEAAALMLLSALRLDREARQHLGLAAHRFNPWQSARQAERT